MTSIKSLCRTAASVLVLKLLLSPVVAVATVSGSTTVTVTTTYTLPTCDVLTSSGAVGTVDFGHFSPGDLSSAAAPITKNFTLTIQCPGSVYIQTSLKMKSGSASTTVSPTGDIAMYDTATSAPNGAVLKVFYNNAQIRPYTSSGDEFCTAMTSGSRSCPLKAELSATSPVSPGNMQADLVFDVDFT